LVDIDVSTLADAARRYTNLRRKYRRFRLYGIAFFAVLATLLLLAFGHRLNPLVSIVLAIPLVLGFLTCWVGTVVAGYALLLFRCPRCGKRFILTWYSGLPTEACKHCYLYLG
jgi:hypothetical protein